MKMRVRQRTSPTGLPLIMAVVAMVVGGLLGLLVVGLTGCSSPPAEPTDSADSIPVSQVSFQSAPTSGWRGEYFASSWLGSPLLVRDDAEIKFDWGSGPPAPEVPADNFSVRWTANPDLPAGLYRLTIWADNRVRMWVDHSLVINGWQDGPRRDFVTHVNLGQGPHPMKLEYYHAFGEASLSLDITYVQPLSAQPPTGGGAPLAVINGPVQALVGQPITFSARDSSGAGGGGIVGFNWSFGDGAAGSGVDVTHAYNAPGAYAVSLTITDETGSSAVATHQIRISEGSAPPAPGQPPTAVINAAAQSYVGQSTIFDASGSQSTYPIVRYAWQLGDGAMGEGMSITHTYMAEGTYSVILVVTDERGLSGTVQHQVLVLSASIPPEAGGPLVPIIAAPSQVTVGQPIFFDASSSQSPNPIVSYAWEFGDGTTANAISVEKIYSVPGTYNVILTLTDDQGLQASTNSAIQVVPEAVLPTVEPEPQPSLTPEVTTTPEAALPTIEPEPQPTLAPEVTPTPEAMPIPESQ
jgi:PKD repeat protein